MYVHGKACGIIADGNIDQGATAAEALELVLPGTIVILFFDKQHRATVGGVELGLPGVTDAQGQGDGIEGEVPNRSLVEANRAAIEQSRRQAAGTELNGDVGAAGDGVLDVKGSVPQGLLITAGGPRGWCHRKRCSRKRFR